MVEEAAATRNLKAEGTGARGGNRGPETVGEGEVEVAVVELAPPPSASVVCPPGEASGVPRWSRKLFRENFSIEKFS